MFLNLFLFYQVARLLGRKSVNKYLCTWVYILTTFYRAACNADTV